MAQDERQYTEINVAAARRATDSVLDHSRTLIDLRHDEDVLVYGEYDLLAPADEQFYAYTRTLADAAMLVVLNWSADGATFDGDVDTTDAALVVSNYDGSPTDPADATFRPYEAAVYRL